MAHSVVVPCPDGDAGGQPKNTTTNIIDTEEPIKQYSSSITKDDFDWSQNLRERYQQQGVSTKAANLILSSWRISTAKQYQSHIQKWILHCSIREIDPILPPISEVLEFLTLKFEEGLSYRTINAYRSALSAFGLVVDRMPVGAHKDVCRLMKGIYNLRPPTAKYSETWDVSVVLRYLEDMKATASLSLRELTFKLIMLIAIVSAARVDTLYKLSIENMKKTNNSIILSLDAPLKQSKVGESLQNIELNRLIE